MVLVSTLKNLPSTPTMNENKVYSKVPDNEISKHQGEREDAKNLLERTKGQHVKKKKRTKGVWDSSTETLEAGRQ